MRSAILLALVLSCLLALGADKGDGKEKSRPEVSIKNLQFKPALLKIKAGQTVTWTNNDDRDHTVAARDKSFKSDNLKPGQTFEHTFKKAGKYAYSCSYHPRMKAEVVVEP